MTDLKLVEQSNSLPEFCDYLYDGLTGYVSAATKEIKEDGAVEFRRSYYQWPEQRGALIDWILDTSQRKDVYVAPAIFAEPSGKREHFKATNVVWAEFDGKLPTDAARTNIPDPTLAIQSSSDENQHWYWRLNEPLYDSAQVEAINRALAYQLGADVSGWDANQILRPPSTFNHKRDKPVFLLSRSESVVSPVNFDLLPSVEATVVAEPEIIPDVTDVILQYSFPKEVSALYRSKPGLGERSTHMMRLGYFLAEMGMSDAEMFSVLRNADDRWGKFKDRTDRNKQLANLISKARLKYPAEVDLDGAFPVYGFMSFLNTEVEIEWVIPGLLQKQGYMLLTGPAGVGKTQFSLRWAINLALGLDFLGLSIAEPQRIIFFSLEMGHSDLKFFLAQMAKDLSNEQLMLLEQNLLLIPLGEAIYMDQSPIQNQVEAILADFNPTGVFIDSVGSSTSGQVSDEVTVKALMDFNDRIRNKHSVFTWWIHHNRKAQGDNKKPNKLADVYGNQYLVNRATSVYCLWPATGSIEVFPLKKRLSAMEDPWHITRVGNLDFIKKASISINHTPTTKLLEDEAPVFTTTGLVDL